MMTIAPFLMTLGVALGSAWLSRTSRDEIVRIGMAIITIIALLLTIVFAPWIVKLAVIGLAIGYDKFSF